MRVSNRLKRAVERLYTVVCPQLIIICPVKYIPKFEGDIREYARFKSQYNKVVKPHVKNEDDEIYVLKTECLKKEAEEHVRNVDDSLQEIWKRLEDRFGRPELASRAFLSDLRQITQVAEGDNMKFIKLVDVVERCYKGLERIGMESEISNSTIIGTIEDRLPPSLKMRWSILKSALMTVV